ncbi:TlpA family protein disulfide reductase [Halalkalibaculum sp. DA3122]|uniref:TlpA family protein disulfide reductase n=1 Tax=unclassified Halalkalibaculum TaxID=2964617 RepID=UPI0037543F5F
MSEKIVFQAVLASLIFCFVFLEGELRAQQVPDAQLIKDINGEELQELVDSYQGEKAVLVNMWATWCGPCVEEFPHIIKLQRKYVEKLQVIFVSADFKKEDALRFLREQGVDWTTYFKTGGDEAFINAISDKWSGAMPFTKILDASGNLVASWENKADFSTFETNVKQAINP